MAQVRPPYTPPWVTTHSRRVSWRVWEGGAESLRLYALVDLDKTLPYNISGVLWTYQPYSSELLPVRFAMAAELQVESGGPQPENPAAPLPGQLPDGEAAAGRVAGAVRWAIDPDGDGLGVLYAAGALLYESPALSSMPVDGRDYGVVQYNGEALSLEWDSQRPRFSLQETRELTREDLYTLLPSLADQEARSGNLLAPQDTQSITVRIYGPSDSAG